MGPRLLTPERFGSTQRETGIPEITPERVSEYLHRIGGFPLLSGDEEVSLARRIEAGVIADGKLDSCLDLDVPVPLVAELLLVALDGDTAYKLLICSNLKLVVHMAKRFSGCSAPLIDLIKDGNRGLIHAVTTFDYQAGKRFPAHASPSIAQAMARGLTTQRASQLAHG